MDIQGRMRPRLSKIGVLLVERRALSAYPHPYRNRPKAQSADRVPPPPLLDIVGSPYMFVFAL
jgi:hypothetical protein